MDLENDQGLDGAQSKGEELELVSLRVTGADHEDQPLLRRTGDDEGDGSRKWKTPRTNGDILEVDMFEKASPRSSHGDQEDVKKQHVGKEWKRYLRRTLGEMLLGSKLNILLVFIPVSVAAVVFSMSQGWIFLFSLLGIAPLAERLGYVTEQLSTFTGPTAGGLLNATFGNATELIISVFALREGLIRVVQLSLLGSILSNMLLVLGAAFFFGGLTRKEQKFNKAAAVVNTGLLLMVVMGLMFPAILQSTHTELHERESTLTLSRFSSCVLLAAYGFYLYFQLKTHAHLYGESEEEAVEEENEEEEESVLGLQGCLAWLTIITVFISILSEYLVKAIEGTSKLWNIPVAFISVIILPIVGNAAEHASAIMFAMKDKLDISLGVAIGSSTQIAMFAIPFCVVIGWVMGVNMDLNFHIFETATLFITVLVLTVMLQEGTASYFKGLMLMLSYLIVGASFYVHSDSENSPSAAPAPG